MINNFFHVAAKASAGTGKTYSLVENYVAALLGTDQSGIKKRPQEILALTFTQKAANEMRLRIATRLFELISQENTLDKDELRRLLRALPNATIATFHGFCASLLRQEARALALNDQFEILLPNEERRLAKNILRPLVMAEVEKHDTVIKSLVARFRLGQGLLSLGLISGLLECYFKLAELGLLGDQLQKPMTIPHLDFFQQDLEKIRMALADFSILTLSPPTKQRLKDIEQALDLLSLEFDTMNEAALAHCYSELRQAVKGNFGDKDARQKLVAAVLSLGAHLVDYFVGFDEEILLRLLKNFHDQFETAKRQQNKLSYADLLLKVRKALGENLHLRRRLKLRFAHILIDEYQDTSPIQEQIIALIAENKGSEQELSKNSEPLESIDFTHGASLFVVGDKKQSIYGFRGADTNLFDRMIRKMMQTHQESQGFVQKLLTINRRSSPRLLNLVNLVSAQTLQAYDSQEDLEPWHMSHPGIAELWVNQDDNDLDKSSANIFCCTHGIAQLLATRPDLLPSDIVILVRRIRSAKSIKEQLAKFSIASRIVGGDGFFQQQEVVDLIAALKLLNDPAHELASAIVLRSPLVLLPDRELLNMTQNGRKLNLSSAAQLLDTGEISKAVAERLNNFLQTLTYIKSELAEKGLAWALDLLVARTDLAFCLGMWDNAEQAFANINKLRSMFVGTKQSAAALIEEYFDHIFNNLKEPQALGAKADHLITIMTIHQSKGLEFKVVVLADGESILPPNQSDFLYDQSLSLVVKAKARPIAVCAPSGRDEQELCPTRFDQVKNRLAHLERAELARLLYVALTRARDELYVVCSQASFQAHGSTKSLIGLFLSAMQQKEPDFLALCPIKHIKPHLDNYAVSTAVHASSLSYEIYKPGERTTRWFSSQLVAPAEWSFSSHIDQDIGWSPPGIDGNLAHQILGLAGTMLASFDEPDEQTLRHLLSASFRAQPIYSDEAKAKITKKACESTLKILSSELVDATRAIFEMPLLSRPCPKIIIEGFADLVIEMPDFVGVLEFKSSARLATHANSYLQIFAYAQSLLDQVKKPVKYGIILVGSKKAITWRDYDAQCQQAFREAIKAQPHQEFLV